MHTARQGLSVGSVASPLAAGPSFAHRTNSADAFIARWQASEGGERANYQLFLTHLCGLLGVPEPDPTKADDADNAYVFERAVTFHHGDGTTSPGFIDLYKRGHFVLEAKQGSEHRSSSLALSQAVNLAKRRSKKGTAVRGSASWDEAMQRARNQAERYARALPASEGRPPFLVVVDVGYSIELYAEFTCTGGSYVPFPDPRSHRLTLDKLKDEAVRHTLRLIWTDPFALDPTRRNARVTRDIAQKLGQLAQSLERAGHAPATVASFLMRCLFTMFAEDMGLLPPDGFVDLLTDLRRNRESFVPLVEELWTRMNEGGISTVLRQKIMRFNGGLFHNAQALPLDQDQFELLLEAARADWRDVEPAIFGTLLERALDPRERHKLGAYYTPRAYVERLVLPTVIEPLREEWEAVKAAAVTLKRQGKAKQAIEEIQAFHRRLCEVRVLDPACGSGNFLYVTLEHLKRLEGEVLVTLEAFGEAQAGLEMPGFSVDPHQLLGLEVNPRAATIAELVLWIGYLQWHFRTRGNVAPPEPVIRNFKNVECRDAVLEWDETRPVLDENGKPKTRWDGHTMKKHPVTGKDVPDETARVEVLEHVGARKAAWPKTDFIVGNPPFLGPARMREALGDGYAEAVRKAHPEVPDSSDFVMFWWNHAAQLVRAGKARRFGLITTNSLRQTFNRRVLELHLGADNPLFLKFAVPDHPWVDGADGAAVRISMTVAEAGTGNGRLKCVAKECWKETEADVDLVERTGKIQSDLTVGANVAGAGALRSNSGISNRGFELGGAGFIVTPQEATKLGLGRIPGLDKHIRPYLNGRDLAGSSRDVLVIDLFGLSGDAVLSRYPEVYQWLSERVRPERAQNRDAVLRERWWLHRRLREDLRVMLQGLPRCIATIETSKHRFFTFLDVSVLPDNKLIIIACNDAFLLGVLSSHIHVTWALAAGGRLGDANGPVYVKTSCFEKFPFPDCTPTQKARIRQLAEALDAHRKRQQAQHPELTLTDTYNVLEKLRASKTLNAKEQMVHEQGLVSVLRQIHDDLDAAVQEAYGWPARPMGDDEILGRLVALNQERAAEEQRGTIRWLRPAFQNPSGTGTIESTDEMGLDLLPITVTPVAAKQPWPKAMSARAQALRSLLAGSPSPLATEAIVAHFQGAPQSQVTELLDTLAVLGQAQRLPDGRWTGQTSLLLAA
jgi:hypothetical protein